MGNVHFFKNMEGDDFLNLLHNSLCLIGNSSVGIRECAYLGVPTVNIGSRQNRRDRGENVVDVSYDENDIVTAVERILKENKRVTSTIYGGGNAGEKIAKLLKDLPLQFHKTITY
jgi:UDP-N-acetylglucosamine 2-epimerase